MELKEIRTERLTLCEINQDDWENYLNHVIDADEIEIQYGYEATEDLLEEIREPTPGVLYYSIKKTDTGDMVGYIGILERFNNIEFHIFREHRNKHYCSEALEAFMKAYLNGEMTGVKHKKIIGRTLFENEPSCRVLETAGFQRGGAGLVCCNDTKTEKMTLQGVKLRYVYETKG